MALKMRKGMPSMHRENAFLQRKAMLVVTRSEISIGEIMNLSCCDAQCAGSLAGGGRCWEASQSACHEVQVSLISAWLVE
jgi:hypothetical protein